MVKINEQNMALSSGLGLAGHVVTNFLRFKKDELFDCCKEDMIKDALKPNRLTAVLIYLISFKIFMNIFPIMKTLTLTSTQREL